MSFCSSVNLRNTRHKLETNARGPPNRRNIMKKTTPAQGSGEMNVYIIRLMSEKLFQLPIPPTIKPTREDAFTSGVSSSQVRSREQQGILVLTGRIGIYV